MTYFSTETASALGALDQNAASDERTVGTAQLRKLVMQGNLLRNYSTLATSVSWHLPASSEGTSAEMRMDLQPATVYGLMMWGAPVWPAHDALDVRVRVRTDSGVVSRLGVQVDDEPITWAGYTGTGALQTVTIMTVPVPPLDTRRDHRMRLYAEGGVPSTAATSIGGTNPLTAAEVGRDFVLQSGSTWIDALANGNYFVRVDNSAGALLWTRKIVDNRDSAGNYYLRYDRQLDDSEYNSAQVSGVTVTVVRAQSLTIAGIAARGFKVAT